MEENFKTKPKQTIFPTHLKLVSKYARRIPCQRTGSEQFTDVDISCREVRGPRQSVFDHLE